LTKTTKTSTIHS